MGNPERNIQVHEAELLPWEMELECAYLNLARDHAALESLEPDSEEEEGLIQRVATRTGNLAKILDRAYGEHGVKYMQRSIRIDTPGPKVRTYYLPVKNKVQNINLVGRFDFLQTEDREHPEIISPDVWVRNSHLRGKITSSLMDLIPEVSRQRILNSVAANLLPVDTN